MAKSYGWAGTVLHIDLTKEKVSKVPTAAYRPEDFIGGVGLSSRIFWELGCPGVAAFDPGNPLIISTGPLTGLYGPFGRGEVCSISPQCYPDELFTYSGFGGMFPSAMKFAGYDAIVVLGKAQRPVYVSIHDEDVKIVDAGDLWGVDTFEAQQSLLAGDPGASALVIGPAGENLSRISIILNETECASGQGGFGAVMGSKNLKAIAVRGTGSIAVSRPDKMLELVKVIKKENTRMQFLGNMNRTAYTAPPETREIFTKKYYQKQYGCYGCPQQCRSLHYIPGIGLSGASCGNWHWAPRYSIIPAEIWEANVLSQKLGINTTELNTGIPLLLKLAVEGGILTGKEIERDYGLPAPAWLGGTAASREFLTVLLNKIARGENPCAGGAARFAEYYSNRSASGKKLLELNNELFTVRGYASHHVDNLGTALHWATDTRDPVNSCHEYKNLPDSATHTRGNRHFGLPPYENYQILDLGKTVYEGTERVTAWVQDNQCLKNSLPVCEFWSWAVNFLEPPDTDIRIFESRLLTAVTGLDMDAVGLSRTAARIWDLRRAIMVKRENRSRTEDTLNEVYFNKAIKLHGGSAAGLVSGPIDKVKFEALKDRYYQLRGWDAATGRPTRSGLEKLGLKDVADGLAAVGRLP
jgi:aldehyde:ferredoxin oxidoreductase